MELQAVMRTRRSVRAYLPAAIAADKLKRIFENVQMAPSANNMQPWYFYLVRQPDLKRQIARLTFGHRFIAQAPLTVLCCGKSYPASYSWIGRNLYLIDCAIAMDHLTLAARNEGLGTCWIGDFDQDGIRKLLKLPAGQDVIMLSPLGQPADQNAFRPTQRRRPLASIVSELA